MVLALAACGGEADPGTTVADTEPIQATTTTGAPDETTTSGEIDEEIEVDGEIEPPPLEPAAFSQSTNVDHTFYPLTPGTQLVFDGVTIEDDEEIPHQIIYTVSDLTKVIGGVEGVVVWILDYSDGELVEAEIAFFAQDDDGNVWHLGEYPEEYEEGEVVAAPAWIHGTEGSKAGIQMPADPQPDTDSYPQGWGPSVEWSDRGRVFEVGSQTCVPAGCYEDVLIIDEFSLDEQTFFQVKYYAPGVGNVQVGWKGNDPNGETLGLTELKALDANEMAEVREAVLALEASAYERSEAYATTEPIRVPE
jgi:hypothetical protein